ncbi:non-ribosomal peptide synthetase [Amycolatopsis pithecellobii]|uniref:Amino acid adenylation domain-containing protein n=1 Tax=Amycolatopsis pithecellobii TaxID=664692 RepID=A0A6N7Z0T4_9PSEU|nr:amino acid adenylation domain-containing protein [Amycolatopsis pithecellobii]MTD53401.1 amino acid adenylation domain-containing protein [Amycolatopsis pithecellobii]
MPGEACHSLTRRLPAGTGDLSANLAALAERVPQLRGARLFTEDLPIASDETAADRYRARESGRVIGAAPQILRAVVLGYTDGVADLVLVARRDAVDRRALDQLATALVDPAHPVELPAPGGEPEPGDTARLSWGLGDPAEAGRSGTVPLTTTVTGTDARELLAAATSLVLARYGESTEFALCTAGPRAATHWTVMGTPVEDATPVSALFEAAPASGATSAVGVLVTQERSGDTYRPVLAPVFPATLAWEHAADGALRGTFHYDRGVLAPEIAAQFARHMCRVVDTLANVSRDTPVGDIELMDPAEVATIVAKGRTAASETAAEIGIHELFRTVALAQPDAPAVSDVDRTLSYAELDFRAGQVAGALREHGVAPGDRVGVCLERDADLVVALLGVLKAGAAYVPMDAAYPAERLAYTVADAGIRVVLAGADFPVDGVTVLRPFELDGPPIEDVKAGADDIAYVIYTSGSTGRPKGVAVPHRNIGALLSATSADLNLSAADTWTLFHSSAFDFSVWEIWGALLSGGTLVVVPYFTARDPEEFHDLLVRHRVTIVNQTPSAFSALNEVDQRRAGDLAVRLVIFGGEPLDVRILPGWLRRHPRCRVVNMFGITETTVHVTSQTVTPREVAAGSRSVGRALPGWSVSVRDTAGRVQPFGVPGEIYVGGAGVASHYLNQPDLTADRFVTDSVTGQRVYRSGDLGRLRQDGRLDHLGRIDSQVKVRGFRIELGEIRSVLLEDPRVTDAVVVLDDDGDAADVRLAAYVVASPAASTMDIRRRAAKYLPEYMVPAAVTLVSELPLTVNGKVDTSKLATSAPPAEPATETGDPVLAVWRKILGEHIEPDDDFFATGGNSLLAVRLSGELRQAGLPPVSLRELYRYSTPAELSAFLRGPEPEPGLSDVGRRVLAAWSEILDIPAGRIGFDDDLFEIGGNSLAAMKIALLLPDLVTLPDVLRFSRLGELVKAAEEAAGDRGGVLIPLTSEVAEPAATVVCVPYAGGNAVHFKPLADAVARLDGRVAVAAVELPGHAPGSTVDDLRSFAATAELVTAEIERTVSGPVVLWGHCNGAPLALDVARRLTEHGHEVRHLFLAAMLVAPVAQLEETLRETESLTFDDIRQYLAAWTGTAELDHLGAGFEELVTRTFRHDATLANEFLLAGRRSADRRPLPVPATMVVATDDKLTDGYETGWHDWGLFVEQPALAELGGGGHYFTRTRPDQVADVIGQRLTDS